MSVDVTIDGSAWFVGGQFLSSDRLGDVPGLAFQPRVARTSALVSGTLAPDEVKSVWGRLRSAFEAAAERAANVTGLRETS
jgi:hypothetical protein